MRGSSAWVLVAAILTGCTGPDTAQIENDVVGGEAGDPPPYFVSLVGAGSSSPFCGGTLIDDDLVLTAAHCVKGHREFLQVSFPSGSRDRSWRWETRSVEAMVVHEGYDGVGDARYDVALLLLDRPAPWRSDERKVRTIWRSASTPTEGELTIMGFGNASNYGWLRADAFQTATAPLLAECRYEGAFCLDRKGYPETNSGDSGGPVVGTGLTGPRLVGVVSGGNADYGFYAPVADLEDWIDERTEQLRRSIATADAAAVAATIESRCFDEPFDLVSDDETGWARIRVDEVAMTRQLAEVDQTAYDTPNDALEPGTWVEGEGCSTFLADETFVHQTVSLHPATQTIRVRAYVRPDGGEKRYFEARGAAKLIPAIGAVTTEQTWLSLNMARTSGWLAEPSGASYQVQPRSDLLPASAVPSSPDYAFEVEEVELRIYERDGMRLAWWRSPLLGAVEARISLVDVDDAGAGGVSVTLALEEGHVVVEVTNDRPTELVAWELSCKSAAQDQEQSYGPFLPDTPPNVGRIPAEGSVEVVTEVSMTGELPGDYACTLNGVDVPLELR